MKISKILNISCIILLIILLIVYIIYNRQSDTSNIENYNNNVIEVNDNFYELETSGDPSKFFSTNAHEFKFGGAELCIYKTDSDSDNGKITDIECLSGDQLGVAKDLPTFRKKQICIDEECLNLNDLLVLLGHKEIQLTSNTLDRPNKNNIDNLQCLGKNNITLNTCKDPQAVIWNEFKVLQNMSCHNNNIGSTGLILEKSLNKEALENVLTDPLPLAGIPTIDEELPGVVQVPVH